MRSLVRVLARRLMLRCSAASVVQMLPRTISIPRRLQLLFIAAGVSCFMRVDDACAAFESYRVVEGCPEEEWLEVEFSVVLENATPEQRRSFSLDVVKTESGFDGALSSHALGFFREISAESCTAVLRGLTLALAVYLETREHSPEPAAIPSGVPTQKDRGNALAPAEGEEKVEVPPRREFSVLAGSEFRNGVAPRAVPTLRVGVSFAELARGWFGSYRFSLLFNRQPRSHVVVFEGGGADRALSHEWSAGSFHACPWLPELTTTFRIGPCVSVYVGSIWVRTEPSYVSGRKVFSFAELGAQLEAHWANFLLQVHAGTHAPTDPASLPLDSEPPAYSQQDGFSVGLAAGWAL